MRIYVAGPYSDNPEPNVDRACEVAVRLIERGHTPYVPHVNHYFDVAALRMGRERFDYETWMAQDFEWLRLCDALYLIAPSPGANREVLAAQAVGIPVYRSLAEVPLR